MPHPSRRRAAIAAVSALALALGACGPSHDIDGHGTIEIDEIDVSSLVGGRVVKLYVDEGDSVRAGDTLAVLDRGEVTATLEAQSAESARAAAQYRDMRAGARGPEIVAANADLSAATSAAEAAENEYQRQRQLFSGGVSSAVDLDRAKSARDAAVAKREASREQLRLLEQGFRKEQVEAAARAAQAATAQVLASRSLASELVLRAPSDGVVLLRNYEVGEVAPPSLPVITIGDPERLWMRVYVPVPLLPRVKRGAAVEVRVAGVPKAFTGHVVEIATEAEFTPRTALTEEERSNLVFGVKVRIDPTSGTLKPGLPADARITAPEGS